MILGQATDKRGSWPTEVLRYNDAILRPTCGVKSQLAWEEGTGVAAEEMKCLDVRRSFEARLEEVRDGNVVFPSRESLDVECVRSLLLESERDSKRLDRA